MPTRRFAAPLAVLLIALLLGGCAGTRLPAEPARSLGDVNARLAGRWAAIERTDGTATEYAEDVRVGPKATTYYDRRERERLSLPTADVRLVTVAEESGVGRGAFAGAAPGILLAGIGAVGLANLDDDGEDLAADIASGLALLGGAASALLGGVAGAIIGGNVIDDEVAVVYRGPVERYLSEPQRLPPR